jgi:hypothetical protein
MLQIYFNNPLWKVPITWRSKYNFNGVLKSCSVSMKNTLKGALENDNCCITSKRTLDALVSRHLCNSKGYLSPQGRVLAISILSLKKQSNILSIPINELEINYSKKPELDFSAFLIHNNFKHVCYSEGGIIMTLLFCMCFKELYSYWKRHSLCKEYGKDYAIGYMYMGIFSYAELLDEFPLLHEHLLSKISSANENDITKAYKILRGWHENMGWTGDNWPFQSWKGLNLKIILCTYQLLTNTKLHNIAKVFFTDPYAFVKGWTDLLAIDKDNQIMLLEVKTTDKLHISQIINMEIMSDYISTGIVKLKKSKNN